MKPVIAYVRVSTAGQADEGVSLEAQTAKIGSWCHLNDAELVATYTDAGISGKRADNRPELQQALEHVCRIGGTLVVYSLSRMSRSTRDTLEISERLAKSDADLVSLSERIDTTSAAGKMVFRMLAVMAEFERDVIGERTSTAMAHKKSQGERVGTVPFGYDLAADGVTLLENPAQQRALELIGELRKAGMTYRQIAAELTNRQIPTAKENSRWSHSTIQRILNRAA